jgi:carbonic anhydrase/acetyltransferase-like protein (isoleucine patch superfamily)
MKGCTLPEGCIAGSNSLLNKDYVKKGVKPYSLMAGMPAKVVGENQSRIFGILEEIKIDRFFKENPEAKIYRGMPGTENENDEEGLLYYWKLWTS